MVVILGFGVWNESFLDYMTNYSFFKMPLNWTSLVVQWLGLRASNAGGTGSIPGGGSSSCREVWPKKKKKRCHLIVSALWEHTGFSAQNWHSSFVHLTWYRVILDSLLNSHCLFMGLFPTSTPDPKQRSVLFFFVFLFITSSTGYILSIIV